MEKLFLFISFAIAIIVIGIVKRVKEGLNRKKTVLSSIAKLITTCEKEIRKTGNKYPYLPDIIDLLKQLERDIDAEYSVREQNSYALFRIVADDYDFLESRLGRKLVRLTNDYTEFEKGKKK